MKYLDGYPELDLLSKSLSFSSSSLRVSTRIEAYSCKAIARERKLFKTIEHDLLSDLSLSTSISPPEHHSSLINSAFGPLDKKDSRKTLWLLIATLNIAFPDHDFSRLSAEEFVREENPRIVLASLTNALSYLRSSNGQEGQPALPLNLGVPIGMEAPYSRMNYSSSAPSSSSHARHSANQQQTKQGKGQSAKDSSNSNGKGSKEESSTLITTETSQKEIGSTTKKSSTSSQHQPRGKSALTSTSSAPHASSNPSSSALNKKKHQLQVSHTALLAQLRNELDGTFEVPTHPLLRQVLDPIIDLSECEVYSYTPDLDSDPHAYQSDDEDEDEEEEEEEEEGEGGFDEYEEDYERAASDGLDMDLEDEENNQQGSYYRPAGLSSAMQTSQEDGMNWEPSTSNGDGTTTPSASVPGTPTGTSKKSTIPGSQKKRGSGATTPSVAGSGKKSTSSKSKSNLNKGSTSVLSRNTKIIPGQSIFGDNPTSSSSMVGAYGRKVPFQYGSLDDYSFSHHQAPHRRTASKSPLHDSISSDDSDGDLMSGNSSRRRRGGRGGEAEEEEDNGGLLWSSNYFFYNRKMKRILFVSCWGRKIGKQFSPSNTLLGRSAGNPLHAYRRQLTSSSYSSYGSGGGHVHGRSGRDGRVTINLNRTRAGSDKLSLPPTISTSAQQGQDENDAGSSSFSFNNNASYNKNSTTSTTSNLTQALRANASSTSGGKESITPLNTSFSSQPPIANAASVFKPSSSPFPGNAETTQQPPLLRHASASSLVAGGSPAQGASLSISRQSTPHASPGGNANTSGTTGGRGMRRVRPNSGNSTPSRKTPKRNNKRRTGSRTPSSVGNAAPGGSSAAA